MDTFTSAQRVRDRWNDECVRDDVDVLVDAGQRRIL